MQGRRRVLTLTTWRAISESPFHTRSHLLQTGPQQNRGKRL